MNYETAQLKEWFNYNPVTGFLTNRTGRTNARPGQRSGWLDAGCGYRRVRIKGKMYLEHRIIFALFHGRWPAGEVDHINGDCLDNRIDNLRDATHRQNCANGKARRPNLSKGIDLYRDKKRWVARIYDGSKLKHLGIFNTKAEAVAAYNSAGRALHGDFHRESV